MTKKYFKLIKDNPKDAFEYEMKLNQQLMGKLDAYERLVKMMLKVLIDAATEKR